MDQTALLTQAVRALSQHPDPRQTWRMCLVGFQVPPPLDVLDDGCLSGLPHQRKQLSQTNKKVNQ